MEDARSKIVTKAVKDPAFRAALLEDPSSAISKELGITIPGGIKVKVVEDSATTVHLVLPAAAKSGELSDAELENAAGGAAAPTYACLMNSTNQPC